MPDKDERQKLETIINSLGKPASLAACRKCGDAVEDEPELAGDYCDRCDPENRPVETSDIRGLKDIPGVCSTLVETNDLDDFSQGPLNLCGCGDHTFIVVNTSNKVNGNSPWYPNTITSCRLLQP